MTNGAAFVLLTLISSPDWAKDVKNLYVAGKLSMRLSDSVEKGPKNDPQAMLEWEKQESEVGELDSAEFHAAASAFQFFAQKGAIRPNRITVELQELLKLTQ